MQKDDSEEVTSRLFSLNKKSGSECEDYGVSFIELLITRLGLFNEPRSIAVYLLRQIRGESLNTKQHR